MSKETMKNIVNYGSAFLLVWLLGFGFITEIFGINSDTFTWKILFEEITPLYAIIVIISYYFGKSNRF